MGSKVAAGERKRPLYTVPHEAFRTCTMSCHDSGTYKWSLTCVNETGWVWSCRAAIHSSLFTSIGLNLAKLQVYACTVLLYQETKKGVFPSLVHLS